MLLPYGLSAPFLIPSVLPNCLKEGSRREFDQGLSTPPSPQKPSRNRTLKSDKIMNAFYVKHFPKKTEPEEEKVTQSLPKWRNVCIPIAYFSETYMRPSFWTTLAWFCMDFKFPRVRPQSLPRRSITKVRRKNHPRSLFQKKNLAMDVQSELQRYPKISINQAPDQPGTRTWHLLIQFNITSIKHHINLHTCDINLRNFPVDNSGPPTIIKAE